MKNFDSERLQDFVNRIENVNGQIDGLTEDRKQIFDEAKGVGYDPKIIRMCIVDRKKKRRDLAAHKEQQDLFSLYSDNLDEPA